MPRISTRQAIARIRSAAWPLDYGVEIIRSVCEIAGADNLIDNARATLRLQGILPAIDNHDSATLFAWLVATVSYQGISDRAAVQYMDRHGRAEWADITASLARDPSCPKLHSYWSFNSCRYRKTAGTCAEPSHKPQCPLPGLPLRNGQLNQAAYSIYLFIRDIADGDLIGWIENQLAEAVEGYGSEQIARMRESLLEPLSHVHGVSHKTLTVALSTLLIGGSARSPLWLEVGGGMIAVDTLVHNFLHRTGILTRHKADHQYGARCYAPDGCADLIAAISAAIDAREFNQSFPRNFPRFVQHAIWQFCAQLALDVCNGNRIEDRDRCKNTYCALYSRCDRVRLKQFVRKKH